MTARRWVGPTVALVTIGLVWGIPEVITRLVDPPLEQYRAMYFGGDANSPRLFMSDPRLVWRLRPEVDVTFLGTRVRTDASGFRTTGSAGAGRRTVLCLGDSTTFGWSVEGRDTYAAELEDVLRAGSSAGEWRVVNAGVPAYSSFQVRVMASEVLPQLHPDVLVVCVGNNDVNPAPRSDREIDRARRLAIPSSASCPSATSRPGCASGSCP